MKKFTIILLLAINVSSLWAQGYQIMTVENSGKMFHIGSLPKSSGNAFQKIKLEVFGGNWHNSHLGEAAYYISSRDGVKVNQTVSGGETGNYTLKIFESASGYDFVVEITRSYTLIWLRSWLLDASSQVMTPFVVENYNPVGKLDVTAQFPTSVLFATSQSGNFGIGTITPDHKLDVVGTIPPIRYWSTHKKDQTLCLKTTITFGH